MSARRPKARLTLQQHQDALNDALNGHARPNDHLDQSDVYMVFCALIDSAEMVNYLRASIAELEAERDAAKAGEARAVEALRKLNISARLAANYADDLKDPDDAWTEIAVLIGEVRGIREVLDSAQPALAWLAQREREAVVAELRDWAERWWESYSDFSAGDFNQRIAAVTTQQPTACPREEK